MSNAANKADVGFLRLVLVSLILCTLLSGAMCIKLAQAQAGAEEIRIAARF
jgi:hypothetical protein